MPPIVLACIGLSFASGLFVGLEVMAFASGYKMNQPFYCVSIGVFLLIAAFASYFA